ncbi:MAG: FkbM family methyltransferase [Alphaproteobacteria bacterium HGW-Alphaproteobacteria-5]|nr:MAG: FkbM family methyltransferase [Alphaproteobacteria bacterium HGW-Alphaproteobacteria-5]
MRSLIRLARFFATHPLTRGAPHKAWMRFAVWQVRSRLHSDVTVEWIEGQKLVARRGMTGATGNFYTGLHEFSDMMLLLHFLREGDLFLDIGANIGSYSVLASGVCGARTVSFEPDPDTARYLARNIAINDLGKRATVHEVALGSHNGETAFTVGLDSTNRVAAAGAENVRTVPLRRLDDIAGTGGPAMIKIDVEGYEEQVLDGATDCLGAPSLKLIELETVTPGIQDILARHGFERAYYDPMSRVLDHKPVGPPSSNALYVRDWNFVDARLKSGRKIHVLDALV